MIIRKATPSDTSGIAAVEQRVFDVPWSSLEIQSLLTDQPSVVTWVVEDQDQLIGYLMVYGEAGKYHILNFAVDIPWQHRGVGKKLLRVCLESLPKNSEITLEVRQGNWNAIHLYEKAGFDTIGIRERYYPDGEDALVMRLDKRKKVIIP